MVPPLLKKYLFRLVSKTQQETQLVRNKVVVGGRPSVVCHDGHISQCHIILHNGPRDRTATCKNLLGSFTVAIFGSFSNPFLDHFYCLEIGRKMIVK